MPTKTVQKQFCLKSWLAPGFSLHKSIPFVHEVKRQTILTVVNPKNSLKRNDENRINKLW